MGNLLIRVLSLVRAPNHSECCRSGRRGLSPAGGLNNRRISVSTVPASDWVWDLGTVLGVAARGGRLSCCPELPVGAAAVALTVFGPSANGRAEAFRRRCGQRKYQGGEGHGPAWELRQGGAGRDLVGSVLSRSVPCFSHHGPGKLPGQRGKCMIMTTGLRFVVRPASGLRRPPAWSWISILYWKRR